MKVALATSPHVRHVAVLQADFVPTPSVIYTFAPVGLLSLAAVVRQHRPAAPCTLYDTNRRILSGDLPLDHRLYDAIADELARDGPDVVGYMTDCDSYHHVLQIAEALKVRAPHCAIVLGGPHASAVAMKTMERCDAVDAVVIGEGEATFLELLIAIEHGSTTSVPGALVRDRARGIVLDGGPRALLESLDALPIPAYDCYRPEPEEEVFVEVGRGCHTMR